MSLKTLIALLIGITLGFAAAMSIQSLLAAGERSKVKRSAADAFAISRALETFRSPYGCYPPMAHDVGQLAAYLEPTYVRRLPVRDSYDSSYLVVMDGSVAAVVSTGRNGFVIERDKLVGEGPSFPGQ